MYFFNLVSLRQIVVSLLESTLTFWLVMAKRIWWKLFCRNSATCSSISLAMSSFTSLGHCPKISLAYCREKNISQTKHHPLLDMWEILTSYCFKSLNFWIAFYRAIVKMSSNNFDLLFFNNLIFSNLHFSINYLAYSLRLIIN